MVTLRRQSPAKLNLTLRVMPVRSDGFHPIESVVVRVALCDEVAISRRDDAAFTLSCNAAGIPTDESNLAIRAANMLAQSAGQIVCGVHIDLHKRIPAGAGLGGGSSNAATVLALLNEIWKTGLTPAALADLGAQIGSDVPLFFNAPVCIVRGRGENITPAPQPLSAWAAIVTPPIHCPTAAVYAAWDRLPAQPVRPSAEHVLESATDIERLMGSLFNDLEPAAFAVNPELAETHRSLESLSDGPVRMTGSGSAFFRLFDADAQATAWAERVTAALSLPAVAVPIESAPSHR